MSNILLDTFKTPFGSVPFEKIKNSDFKPAFLEAIKIGKKEIEKIVINKDKPTFENTFEALERSGSKLNKISTIFFNLNSAETCDEIQQIAQEISPLLSEYSTSILLNSKLFERIDFVYNNVKVESLNTEQKTLLEETYTSFLDNGAKLPEKDKITLKDINEKLSSLSLKFGENVLNDNNSFELHITVESDLVGLPKGVKEAAKLTAKSKDKDGWIFTLDYPSYIPFMQYADNRDLRKKMFIAFGSKGFQKNENNNEKNVKEISKLRLQKAKLLGFSSHAEKTLKKRMALNYSNIENLYSELLDAALPIAKNELEEVRKFALKLDNITDFQRWDFAYYSEKLKKEKFNINDEILKPYFKLENVIDGAFKTAEKLFSISFKQINTIEKYHKDVETYEVLDDQGKHLALFYADFFPRKGKRGGAWMTSYQGQNKYENKEQRPHVSIVCNFTKPTETKPSLLTFQEVTTLFHEFGHALHGMFAKGYYESLSGTNVYWDFVELPSQLMENWCYEKECLDIFAKHYETKEPIPLELIKKIKDSANFMSGYQTVRQVSLGKLDMAWHNIPKENKKSVYEVEKSANAGLDLFPEVKETLTSTAFSHIFQGGYSAGYYSYKWAEVLEADAFEFFKENGIFNKDIASKFKENILQKGGSEHPMKLYKRFRGKEPDSKALLRKCGLL